MGLQCGIVWEGTGTRVARHLLLDLDLTLYPPDAGLMDEMNRRIERYVESFLRVSPEEAERLRRGFRDRHGTTLRGLLVEHGADPRPFMTFVHEGLPGDHLAPNPALAEALARLDGPIHLFTNAPADYASRALGRLGLSGAFDRVFDLAFTDYWGKPHPEAYHRVREALGAESGDCLLIDDSLPNVRGALGCGWRAIWMAYGEAAPKGLETVEDPGDLVRRLQELGGSLGTGRKLA